MSTGVAVQSTAQGECPVSITVTCDQVGAVLKAPDTLVGAVRHCTKCDSPIHILGPHEKPTATAKLTLAKVAGWGAVIVGLGALVVAWGLGRWTSAEPSQPSPVAVVEQGPTSAPPDSRPQPQAPIPKPEPVRFHPKVEIPNSPELQSDRQDFIAKLIVRGVFARLEQPASLPHLWVTPTFMALDFKMKEKFVSIVFAYCYADADEPGRGIVVIKDSRTGKRIGSMDGWGLHFD